MPRFIGREGGAWLLLAVLILPGGAPADAPGGGEALLPLEAPSASAPPAEAGAWIEMPSVHGDVGAVSIDISITAPAVVGMAKTPYWYFFAAGAISVPLSVIDPVYGLGALYPVIGPPMNAWFNARRATLIRAAREEPLPRATLDALMARLETGQGVAPAQVRLQISHYGLVSKSGKLVETLSAHEEFCLTVQADLALATSRGTHNETLRIGSSEAGSSEPPPICGDLDRFARDNGRYLRQAIGELAEVLAALVHTVLVPGK